MALSAGPDDGSCASTASAQQEPRKVPWPAQLKPSRGGEEGDGGREGGVQVVRPLACLPRRVCHLTQRTAQQTSARMTYERGRGGARWGYRAMEPAPRVAPMTPPCVCSHAPAPPPLSPPQPHNTPWSSLKPRPQHKLSSTQLRVSVKVATSRH